MFETVKEVDEETFTKGEQFFINKGAYFFTVIS